MQNRRQFLGTGTALTLGALLWNRPSLTDAAERNIIRIEEDWEIKVSSPNPDRHTPEVVTSMGPVADDSEPVVCLLINHATQPDYTPGGVQLQVWSNGHLRGYSDYASGQQLAVSNETILFTLVMAMEGTKLKFQIVNGSSTTFGSFAGLSISAPTQVSNLNSYSPADSIRRSKVNVGVRRLTKYQINQVRYSAGNNLSGLTDSTVRSVIEV